MPEYVPVRARKLRYRQFAHKYVKNGCNGLQTVLDCGFTDNHRSATVIASRLLTYVSVQQEIEKRMNKVKLSADQVIENLSDIAETHTDIDGNQRLKALELLGKFHKLFVDRTESVDLTQQSATESALLKSIQSASQRDSISPENAAIQLYSALSDDPSLADVNSWPAEFRPAILQAQQPQAVDTIVDGGEC